MPFRGTSRVLKPLRNRRRLPWTLTLQTCVWVCFFFFGGGGGGEKDTKRKPRPIWGGGALKQRRAQKKRLKITHPPRPFRCRDLLPQLRAVVEMESTSVIQQKGQAPKTNSPHKGEIPKSITEVVEYTPSDQPQPQILEGRNKKRRGGSPNRLWKPLQPSGTLWTLGKDHGFRLGDLTHLPLFLTS